MSHFQIQNLHGKVGCILHPSTGSCMPTWSLAGGTSACWGTFRSWSLASEHGSFGFYVLAYFLTNSCLLITDSVLQLPLPHRLAAPFTITQTGKPILPALSCFVADIWSWQHEEQPIHRENRAVSEARRVDLEPVGANAERISLALREDIPEYHRH